LFLSPVKGHNHPGIPTRSKHGIHEKPAHAAIAIHVGMNIHKNKITQDGPDRYIRLTRKQFKKDEYDIMQLTDIDGNVL
jgi:hypothetical protein